MQDDIEVRLRRAFDSDDVAQKNVALRKAADQIAALRAEVERLREAADLLAWLATTGLELTYEGFEDDVWQVHQVNGGRNDREWTQIAEGDTPVEVLRYARSGLAGSCRSKTLVW